MNNLNESQKLNIVQDSLRNAYRNLMDNKERIYNERIPSERSHVDTACSYQVIVNLIDAVRLDGATEKQCVVEAQKFAMDEYRRMNNEPRTASNWMMKTAYYDIATYLAERLEGWEA